MGQLVFQATLGGQVNLVGPNTASTFNLNVPATSSTIATLTGTETFTNKTLTSPTLTTPVLGTPASGTLTNCTGLPNAGLTNSSVTVGSTSIALGATSTTLAGLTGVTSSVITDSGLTSGRVTYASTGGLLADSANLTFNGTTLTTANDASISGLTVGKGGGSVATNTAVGGSALAATATGGANTAVGQTALNATTSGANNTGIGVASLLNNTTGATNSALGVSSLRNNTSGSYNVAFGVSALESNTTADNNTAVGYQAGYAVTTGAQNTCIGRESGKNITTGGNNTCIGYNNSLAAANNSASIIITAGGGDTGKGSSTGYISPGGGGVYQGNNSTLWSITSDQRLKKNIVDHTEGLDKIVQLRVRNYEYRLPEEVTELEPQNAVDIKGVQLGLIAQELAEVLPDCVKTESTGVMSVDATNITWHMINAIKDLKALNDSQAATITALTARVVALEAK